MSGWVSIGREIQDHPIFHLRHDRFYAWVWMIRNAAWRDTVQDAGGKNVVVKRGQLLTSLRQMQSGTAVSIKVLRGLIDRLKAEHAIDTNLDTGRLLITICNYDKYQNGGEAKGTPAGTARAHQGHIKEQDNNSIPNGMGAGASRASPSAEQPPGPSDWQTRLWREGTQIFIEMTGMPEPSVRKLIGKWRKLAKDDCRQVLRVLEDARDHNPADPVPWIEGALRNRGRPAGDALNFVMMRH